MTIRGVAMRECESEKYDNKGRGNEWCESEEEV